MPRNGSGVASKPAGTTAVAFTTIESAKFNQVIDDIYAIFNDPAPVVKGGTGATTAADARTNLDVPKKVTTTTDNTLVRFDGTSGQHQASAISVSDGGAMSGLTSLTMAGALSGVTSLSMGGALTGVTNLTMSGNLSGVVDLTITGAANFGSMKIGEASFVSDAPLEVSSVSGIALAAEYKGGAGGGGIGVNRTSSDGSAVVFYRAASLVGSISVTASATAYNTSSDYRVKEEVEPYAGGLSAIQALNPCTFVMKADPYRVRQLGFIAHEVQAVLPLAVTGSKDAVDENGDIIIQQLDLSKIVPALVSAVKELAAEVAELRSQISSL